LKNVNAFLLQVLVGLVRVVKMLGHSGQQPFVDSGYSFFVALSLCCWIFVVSSR
jgi:hypothetical protein